MSDVGNVLDASALLALIRGEIGGDMVAGLLPDACISAVNLSEVIAKLVERGVPSDEIAAIIAEFDLDVRSFGEADAIAAGLLRANTRRAGLSLGDRACLSLAGKLKADAVTTDRAWNGLDVPITVNVVR